MNEPPAPQVSRIMLVDDHATFREPLAFMFNREPDFEVVAQAGSVAEARQNLGGIDLAVVDLDLPDGDGTDLIGALRAVNPRGIALVLTANANREAFARVVEAGAAGVLHKTVRIQQVVDGARTLLSGKSLFSAGEVIELLQLAEQSRERDRDTHRYVERLTPRELEVLRALADGLSDKEMSESAAASAGERACVPPRFTSTAILAGSRS